MSERTQRDVARDVASRVVSEQRHTENEGLKRELAVLHQELETQRLVCDHENDTNIGDDTRWCATCGALSVVVKTVPETTWSEWSGPDHQGTWRDWQKLVETERANTAEAVRQRDETNTRLSESLWRENALGERLAEALAVRDDNEAVAVERLDRLALVEADAKALAKALDDMLSYALSNRGGKYEFVTCRSDADIHAPPLDAGRAALAVHEALKSK